MRWLGLPGEVRESAHFALLLLFSPPLPSSMSINLHSLGKSSNISSASSISTSDRTVATLSTKHHHHNTNTNTNNLPSPPTLPPYQTPIPTFRATICRINTKPSTCDSTLPATSPPPQRSNPPRQSSSSLSPNLDQGIQPHHHFTHLLGQYESPRIVGLFVVNGQRPRRMS